MPSEPPRDSQSDTARKPLPFEPAKSRKKSEQKAAPSPAKSAPSKAAPPKPDQPLSRAEMRASMAIPEVVSRRMAKRMALFCGIPTLMGVSIFFSSYFIVTNDLFPLPNAVVVLSSLACFGLGVLGLSYGVISASWDEEASGSWLGWEEFTTNLGRLVEAWRASRQKP